VARTPRPWRASSLGFAQYSIAKVTMMAVAPDVATVFQFIVGIGLRGSVERWSRHHTLEPGIARQFALIRPERSEGVCAQPSLRAGFRSAPAEHFVERTAE
jgi:hypothetical protein